MSHSISIRYITLPFWRLKPFRSGLNPFDLSQWPNEPFGEIIIPVVATSAMTEDDILLEAITARDSLLNKWLDLGNCII